MKIVRYNEGTSQQFDGDSVKGVTGRVLIGKNDKAENFCMRSFTVSPGGFTPKHIHDWEHEVFIYKGEGTVFKQDEYIPVKAGDALFIPGREEHHFKNDSDADLIFICLVPKGVPEL